MVRGENDVIQYRTLSARFLLTWDKRKIYLTGKC